MKRSFSQLGRAERVIAAGRVMLSSVSLFAVWLHPSQPARHAAIAYGLLIVYVVYAVTVAVLVAGRRALPEPLAAAVHGLDLLVATLVMFFTEGATSPFLTYFVFALVSGTLRWQWRGALWTGATVAASFLALSIYSGAVARAPGFQLNRSIIRGAYLVVVAFLLAHMGHHEARLHQDLENLAGWPRGVAQRLDDVLREALGQAAVTLRAPRMALAWEEPEEPWFHLALWAPDALTRTREPPGRMEPLVAPPLSGKDFLCADPSRFAADVLFRTHEGFSRWRGAPLHEELRSRLAAHSLIALNLAGETLSGWLFALDATAPTADDLVIGSAVAHQVAAHLDQVVLADRLRSTAAVEERVRLARDLHDGVMQSLAAAGLKLEAAWARAAEDPDGARLLIRDVQDMLVEEQRSLRAIAGSLGPSAGSAPEPEPDVAARLAEVAERIKKHWGLLVDLRAPEPIGTVSGRLAGEACRIVHEALVNAARHGHASGARLELSRGERDLRIAVTDDGRGFSFEGVYDLAELAARKMGPLALRERIGALQGSLRIASSRSGVRLDIGLPLTGEGG